MARRVRAPKLETRTSRLNLPVRKKPYFVKIAPGIALGYRRNGSGSGPWSTRLADGQGGNTLKAFSVADDFQDANGTTVLAYGQALERALALAAGNPAGEQGDALATVDEALTAFAVDLQQRNRDGVNVSRVRRHLPAGLGATRLDHLKARDLRLWQASLARKGLSSAASNRTIKMLKAALNLAARQDERIVSRHAWEQGLSNIAGAESARNVILTEPVIRDIVAAAYEIVGPEFGLLVELAAVTGARPSQLARLAVADVQAGRADPRVMMPSSFKGRGRKAVQRRPVPVPAALAARLALLGRGRPDDAPLLIPAGGGTWMHRQVRPFTQVAEHLGLGDVTFYSLRHSSIVRALLVNTPVRVVASTHDTSIVMIEAHYSQHISDHSDALARRSMIDFEPVPPADNVTTLVTRRVPS
jgi:integrase